MCRPRSASAVVALVASITVTSLQGTPAGAAARTDTRRPCKRPGERVVAHSRKLMVVTRRPKGRLVVCVRATRTRHYLTDDFGWFPSVAVAGGTVAYAEVFLEGTGANHYLTVLRYGPRPLRRLFSTQRQVGSIVVKKSGAVAWIDCVTDRDADGQPRRCRKPNQSLDNDVTVAPAGREGTHGDAGAFGTVLDCGPGIDPSFLRLKGLRLTWKHDGEIRHGSLRETSQGEQGAEGCL